ncbi:hypothetical protein SAMN05444172_2607 [Burkholderia sp. GAS332]|nr:hypothetical protein SAMN05444172_2607 [Burkholderia sp. GAS332]
MNLIALIATAPSNGIDVQRLHNVAASIGELPAGIIQPAINVWLIDPTRDLDFVLTIAETLRNVGIAVVLFNKVP